MWLMLSVGVVSWISAWLKTLCHLTGEAENALIDFFI